MKMKDKMQFSIKKYLVIALACTLYGVGISLFVDPNNLAPGGFTGLSVIINRLIPLETGTIYLILNIPVIILGIWKFGWKFTISTLYAILIVSGSTNLIGAMRPVTQEPILGAVFGGVLIGVGMGLVLRNSATTGGTDIIVKCLRQRFPHMKTGSLMLMIDAVIIGTSGLVFGNFDSVLYSIVSVMTTSVVLDMVLYGRDGAKLVYIISDRSEVITTRILNEVNIGVTHLEGSGAYQNKEKKVIMCVVKKQLAYKVEEIVKEEDTSAFMIISSASEIYGEGYKSYFGEII
ncbi:MAG: YitT family protein [Lachnospiraceae bacterium]|nr:YitT family protein [Lachnospiraceae bacterium]